MQQKNNFVSKLTIAHHMSVPNWPDQFYNHLLWAVGILCIWKCWKNMTMSCEKRQNHKTLSTNIQFYLSIVKSFVTHTKERNSIKVSSKEERPN
jgi:hypothetical protein